MSGSRSHAQLAEELRRRVTDGGVLDATLRTESLRAGAGEPTELAAPHLELAALIGQASYRVTDAQVAAVRRRLGSDQAAFELIMAASVGAGLRRWDAAARAISEATDAAG